MAEISALLNNPGCRLLTLLGPGGIGKTRLAIQAVAQQAGPHVRHGIFFVPLQAIHATDFVISAIAAALDFSLAGQEEPIAQVSNYLRDKELLLLLDNFEQLLVENGEALVSHILAAAPGVKLLVTSREALNLQEEWLYPVSGLSLPDDPDTDVETFDAIQLFMERAQRIRRDFSLAAERQAVVRICRLVEGMPLAIELAAAWLKTMNCAAIAAEIQRTIDFLSTSMRNVPARHRNMQAVFDQSWKLLTSEERRAFKQLSVFKDGFQREAAEAVVGTTLPILSTLVDKCMLRWEDRYYIHELLRQYGEEKLQESAEEAEQARDRHGQYYIDFLHCRLDAINGSTQRQAVTEITAELENIRAAWQWAVAQANVEAIHKAASTFYLFCQMQSYYLEGANAIEDAVLSLEQQPVSKQLELTLAQLFNHQGAFYLRIGEFDKARTMLERSRALYCRLDTPPPSYIGADPATPLAIVYTIQGDYDAAVALGESAREGHEARGDKHNLSFIHYGLTAARLAQGQYQAANNHAERACTLARAVGNRWFLAYPLNEWGNVARALGDYAEAKKHYQASYAIRKEYNDPEGMAVALNHLGEIALLQAEFREARTLFQQSLDIYRDLNDRGGLAASLKGLGQVACAL